MTITATLTPTRSVKLDQSDVDALHTTYDPNIGKVVAIPDSELYGPVLSVDVSLYGDVYFYILTSEGLMLIEEASL